MSSIHVTYVCATNTDPIIGTQFQAFHTVPGATALPLEPEGALHYRH
jgi:hypothetical protein